MSLQKSWVIFFPWIFKDFMQHLLHSFYNFLLHLLDFLFTDLANGFLVVQMFSCSLGRK